MSRIYVKHTDKVISCGTCKYDCSQYPRDQEKAVKCLSEGEDKVYHDWKRYSDRMKYSEWEPICPVDEGKLPDELFEVDI